MNAKKMVIVEGVDADRIGLALAVRLANLPEGGWAETQQAKRALMNHVGPEKFPAYVFAGELSRLVDRGELTKDQAREKMAMRDIVVVQ